MLEDLLKETQQEFGLLDEPPVMYYAVTTNTGLVIRGVIKQYLNAGITTLEGTGARTIAFAISKYDWVSLDLDDSGYTGPLQIVGEAQSTKSVDKPYTHKFVMHEYGCSIRVFISKDKEDMFYTLLLSLAPSVVEISKTVFNCDGSCLPVEVKNFIKTHDGCY